VESKPTDYSAVRHLESLPRIWPGIDPAVAREFGHGFEATDRMRTNALTSSNDDAVLDRSLPVRKPKPASAEGSRRHMESGRGQEEEGSSRDEEGKINPRHQWGQDGHGRRGRRTHDQGRGAPAMILLPRADCEPPNGVHKENTRRGRKADRVNCHWANRNCRTPRSETIAKKT